jgi:hypothetical protein
MANPFGITFGKGKKGLLQVPSKCYCAGTRLDDHLVSVPILLEMRCRDIMIEVQNIDQGWLTLQQASEITGKSVTAIRMLIKRKRLNLAKKIKYNGRNSWIVHEEVIKSL